MFANKTSRSHSLYRSYSCKTWNCEGHDEFKLADVELNFSNVELNLAIQRSYLKKFKNTNVFIKNIHKIQNITNIQAENPEKHVLYYILIFIK